MGTGKKGEKQFSLHIQIQRHQCHQQKKRSSTNWSTKESPEHECERTRLKKNRKIEIRTYSVPLPFLDEYEKPFHMNTHISGLFGYIFLHHCLLACSLTGPERGKEKSARTVFRGQDRDGDAYSVYSILHSGLVSHCYILV